MLDCNLVGLYSAVGGEVLIVKYLVQIEVIRDITRMNKKDGRKSTKYPDQKKKNIIIS